MEADSFNSLTPLAGFQQVVNNSTGWVGHLAGQKVDSCIGQTFIAPLDGHLQSIEIMPNAVAHSGHVKITVHQFDSIAEQWGTAIDSADVEINSNSEGHWVKIPLHKVPLAPGKTYGFKLASDDTLIGVAEAASSSINHFHNGGEWIFKTNAPTKTYAYYSLAYKLKMGA